MRKVIADKTAEDKWYLSTDVDFLDELGGEYEYYEGFIQNDFTGTRIYIEDQKDAQTVCNAMNDEIKYRDEVQRLQAENELLKGREDAPPLSFEAFSEIVEMLKSPDDYDKKIGFGYSGDVGELLKDIQSLVNDRLWHTSFTRRLEARRNELLVEVELLQAELAALRANHPTAAGDTVDAEMMSRYAAYAFEAKADYVTPLPFNDWQRQHAPDDYSGFRFTRPNNTPPVRFFDDDARQAMKSEL